MRNRILWLCVLAVACHAGAAMAVNMRFLRNTPMARFNEQDNKLLQAAFVKAMNEGADGSPVEWRNDRTGAGGTITPIESFEREGAKCRKAQFTTYYKTLKGGGDYSFCKNAKGTWQLVQSSP
jgi:surface antigen